MKPVVETEGVAGLDGRSPQGERGLKLAVAVHLGCVCAGRSPQGERGLKPATTSRLSVHMQSLPARGAWVETNCDKLSWPIMRRRPPQGERGLKHSDIAKL